MLFGVKRKTLPRATASSQKSFFKLHHFLYILLFIGCTCFLLTYRILLSLPHHQQQQESSPHQQQQQHQHHQFLPGPSSPHPTIGYAISITACPDDNLHNDAAAVLQHSIALSQSKYPHQMYAIVHPSAESCTTSTLSQLGYEVLIRDVPVAVDDIQGEYMRMNIRNNGCCGETEFIKLWAYTLTNHPIVVHLDLDTLILRKLDDLFDAMLLPRSTTSVTTIPVAFDKPLPPRIDAFFTRDYNMVRNRERVGVQGGFLVLRPSLQTFDDLKAIIREGDYNPKRGGWGGSGFGNFYGAMTFQGIIPYYYDIRPKQQLVAVELNRCYYNTMADNPRDRRTVNDVVSGNCRDGRDECEDCRSIPLEKIVTVHYTICYKPWLCLHHKQDMIQHRLCRKLHHEWYKVRADLEERVWGRGKAVGTHDVEQTFGFCTKFGHKGYIPMKLPD